MTDAGLFCPGLEADIQGEPAARRRLLEESLSRMAASDLAAAGSRLKEALKMRPLPPPAAGLMGLVKELGGRPREALRWFDRAAKGAPKRGWPHVLKAASWLRRGRAEDARAALGRAIEVEPEPSTLMMRARLLSSLGYVAEAVADLDAALRLGGPSAELHALRASWNANRRKYPAALRDVSRAIRLEPGAPAWRSRRSELRLILNRLDAAQRDADEAARLAPGDEGLLAARLKLAILRNRPAEAEGILRSLPGSLGPEARFYAGVLALKRGRPGEAARAFRALTEGLPADGALSMRARLYWLAAQALDPEFIRRHRMTLPKTGNPKLFLCGLGLFPPYTATLEVLHALSRSDVLFNNLPGVEVRELLSSFCGDVRPATYDAKEDEHLWADRIFAELKAGRTVAFVTRGHPLVFGRLACELVHRCRAQGVPLETFGSVSSIDVLLARAGLGLGDHIDGVQAYDFPALEAAKALNAEQPTLLNFYDGVARGGVARVRRQLERFYPKDHACWVYGPKYDTEPVEVRVRDLEKKYPEIHASLILFVPGLAKPPASQGARPKRVKKGSSRGGSSPAQGSRS